MELVMYLWNRYWSALYWLAFACLAVYGAQDSGYLVPRYRPLPPFPWTGVVVAWLVLAAQVTALHYFISRRAHARSWARRLRDAWLYAFLLTIVVVLMLPTDMPGIVVATASFAPCTLILLSAIAVAMGVHQGFKQVRHVL